MKCPACETTLAMTDRQGIEIDYCPQCRGVWLDRGELDKLIERSTAAESPPQPARPQPQAYQQQPPQHHGGYPRHGDDGYRHKKKKNLLGELFDF